MTTTLYMWCVAMFILGQALQLFWMKIPSLKKRATASNYVFTLKDYWKEDWYLILGTQVLGALAIIGLNELAQWKPEIIEYVRWFFAGIGYFASSVILSKLSAYETKLLNVIDLKTNTADLVSPVNAKGAPLDMIKQAPGEK